MKFLGFFLLLISDAFGDWAHPSHSTFFRLHKSVGETESAFWHEIAEATLNKKLSYRQNKNKAKNVILFLGDGMSIPTLAATRAFQSELKHEMGGEGSSLVFEKFPYSGLSKTYCVDYKVADSACSATAYLGGVKANEGTIGVNGKVLRGNCKASNFPENKVYSIVKWFQDKGRPTGIVTTTRVTHASPAGTYAHIADREWECDGDIRNSGQDSEECDDIAEQLILKYPGKKINVIMGGGFSKLLPVEKGGKRQDGKDLISTWTAQKVARKTSYEYVTSRDELLKMNSTPKYLLGIFAPDHLDYHYKNNTKQPTLAEMTKAAIKVLQKSDKGFFLFVEGGLIDFGHHGNQAHVALDETNEFQKAVQIAKQMTSESDTLIVVTADHAHTMSYSGYPERSSSIFAAAGNASDGKPYAILSYANGPGYKESTNNKRYDFSKDDLIEFEYKFPAGAPLDSETHGGDDVAVFADGPWSHLFTGSIEENFIPHAMAFAACVGQGKENAEHCRKYKRN